MAERWNLTGQVLVACNCDWGCPCNFNARPSKGKCEGGWTWHVDAGTYGDVALDGACHQVAADDAARPPVDDDQVEHLAAGEHPHRLLVHLAHQRLVGAEQQLLTGLAARIEGSRHLRAAERSVVEQAAVFTSERHAWATHWSMILTLSCANR